MGGGAWRSGGELQNPPSITQSSPLGQPSPELRVVSWSRGRRLRSPSRTPHRWPDHVTRVLGPGAGEASLPQPPPRPTRTPLLPVRTRPHLAVGADEERLDLDAVADHGHGIAGGRGDDGIGYPGAAQGGGDGRGLGLGLAAGWRVAHGVVGGGECGAGVLDTDRGGLLGCRGLLGRQIPARGDREAVWNQSLWPNLGREGRSHGQTDTQAG